MGYKSSAAWICNSLRDSSRILKIRKIVPAHMWPRWHTITVDLATSFIQHLVKKPTRLKLPFMFGGALGQWQNTTPAPGDLNKKASSLKTNNKDFVAIMWTFPCSKSRCAKFSCVTTIHASRRGTQGVKTGEVSRYHMVCVELFADVFMKSI